jgi:hypothetical protein
MRDRKLQLAPSSVEAFDPIDGPAMRTWLVYARSLSGEHHPIGLVSATTELAALARARTKAKQLRGYSDEDTVVLHVIEGELSTE